ncbi:hypothetical protein JDS87_28880, partial [Bacillus cereus]|nr:hypothetical protein [Bacillus cereus]
QELKEEKHMPEGIQLRQVRYLNNIVKQDHTFILEKLGRQYDDLFSIKENGCWYLTVNKKVYSEKRLGIAACLAAVDTVRHKK